MVWEVEGGRASGKNRSVGSVLVEWFGLVDGFGLGGQVVQLRGEQVEQLRPI